MEKGVQMGKNPNSFQKRQREFDKKRKAEDKRKRRAALKNAPVDHNPSPVQSEVEKSASVDEP
jgi:hypothetical protein